jgi:hypothetical protein
VTVATGHYRLDPESHAFFESPIIHFVQHDAELVGHFGRHGTVRGFMHGCVLEGNWKCRERGGWIRLTFDPSRRTLEGEYGLEATGSAPSGYFRAAAQRT